MVVLLLGFWLLLGCDNTLWILYPFSFLLELTKKVRIFRFSVNENVCLEQCSRVFPVLRYIELKNATLIEKTSFCKKVKWSSANPFQSSSNGSSIKSSTCFALRQYLPPVSTSQDCDWPISGKKIYNIWMKNSAGEKCCKMKELTMFHRTVYHQLIFSATHPVLLCYGYLFAYIRRSFSSVGHQFVFDFTKKVS